MSEGRSDSDDSSVGPPSDEPGDESIAATDAPPFPQIALIDRIAEQTSGRDSTGPAAADRRQEGSLEDALRWWAGERLSGQSYLTKERLVQLINADIARLDDLLCRGANAILHHPRFQKLEASWRGLRYLVDKNEDEENIKIRVLSVTWKELAQDAERAMEFDQSQLFGKIYSEEFGTPGGRPFGLLLGDYEIRHRISSEHRINDVAVLESICSVAAAAFCPFLASAHPALFGMDTFAGMQRPLNLPRTFEQLEYLKWNSFRDTEDSRFVGLLLPRVLMRLPHTDAGTRTEGFWFREDVEGPDLSKYLWGNAIYAFGGVVMRAFAETGWLAEIRGVRRGLEEGGVVTGLAVHSFSTDSRGVALKYSTDVLISDERESELGSLGFIPLCHSKDTRLAAFYGNQSVQQPKVYDRQPATTNARLSAMLQYMLCVARFAHYVKVIGRDTMGSFSDAGEFEDYLHRWMQKYVTSDDDASQEVKATFPLREGRVRVRERPDKPGSFSCVIHLRPHFQLERLIASVKLVTELAPSRTG